MIGPRVGIRPVPGRVGLAVGMGEDQAAPNPPQSSLSLVLADSADPVGGSVNFDYTAVVANTGAEAVTNVQATIALDSHLTYVSAVETGQNILFVLHGHSQPLGFATEPFISVPTYGDLSVAYSAVQSTNHNSDATTSPITYYDEGPSDLKPRTIAVGTVASGTFGPELTLGRHLDAAYPNRVFCSKMCVGGSAFINHWDDTAHLTFLLTPFITFVQSAMAAAGITDPNNVFLVGINGYNDIGATEAAYRAALDDFYGRVRTAIGNCWVILDRLATGYDAIGHIRAAQTSFAASNIRNGLVDSDGFATRVDTGEGSDNHWASDSVAEFGVRAAAKAVAMRGSAWTISHVGQVVTATLPSLAAGATAPTVDVTVTSPSSSMTVTTTATATATGATAATPASENTVVNATTTLTLSLTDSADPVMTSGAYSYAAVVTNTGSSTATTVSAVIVCPANSTFVSASGTGWTCVNSGHTVTCTRASLAVGVGPTITINVTSAAAAETSSATLDATAANASNPTQSTQTTGVLLVTKDATSGIRCPANATEWANVGTVCGFTITVDLLWLGQEGSGNLADTIGTATGTKVGSPSYAQPETGWSRKGFQLDNTGWFFTTDASLPALASASQMMIFYADMFGTEVADRYQCYMGSSGGAHGCNILKSNNSTGIIAQFDGVTANSNTSHGGQVRPFVVQFDRTNSKNLIYTDLVKLQPAFQTGVLGKVFELGDGNNTSTRFLYACSLFGAHAELTVAQVKTMLQALGWTVAW